MNLLLIHQLIGRLQAGDVGRQTLERIVSWNHGSRIIPPHDCIHLSAREDCLDRQNENVNIFQIVIE